MKLPASKPEGGGGDRGGRTAEHGRARVVWRDRRPHGEPGQVDQLEDDPHLGAGGHVPEDRPHQRGDDKGAVEHQLTRRRPVEVAHPPEKNRQEEPPGHPYSLSASNDVPDSNGVPWTRTVTPCERNHPRASKSSGAKNTDGEISTFPAAK